MFTFCDVLSEIGKNANILESAQCRLEIIGRNPLNQNFRAEVRNFFYVQWIATGPKRSRSIPLAKQVSRRQVSFAGHTQVTGHVKVKTGDVRISYPRFPRGLWIFPCNKCFTV